MMAMHIERVRVWAVKNTHDEKLGVVAKAYTLGVKIRGRWATVAQHHKNGECADFANYSKCIYSSILAADRARDKFAANFECAVQEVDGLDDERNAARASIEARKSKKAQDAQDAQDAEQARQDELTAQAQALLADPDLRTAVAALVSVNADFRTVARAMKLLREEAKAGV